MEVLVLHSQHLTLTCLSTLVALDQGLLCGVVVCVLRMSHCERRHNNVTTESAWLLNVVSAVQSLLLVVFLSSCL